jgi:AcrR family transcriptional regulator
VAPLSEAKRASYHHGALKEALLAAAAELIAARGPEGFSLLDSAKACGVGASAPYKHFPDKAALLRAVAARGATLLGEALRLAWSSPEGFAGMGAAYLRFARENPGEYAAMFATHGTPELRGAGQALSTALAAHGGGGRAAERLRGQIWALSHGAAMLERSGMLGPADADAIVHDGVARLLKSGLSG